MTAQSSIPLKWYVPFAQGDSSRVELPVTTSDPTRASQTLGFPPLTMQPPESGGVPPQGEDFNGGLNQVARIAWWVLNGGGWPYDSVFASNSNINGYPNGATLQAADLRGDWISVADNNQNNPDTGTGAAWVPGFQYGTTSLTGLTGGTVTPTPAQAAKNGITLAGTLASALTIVLPAWAKNWTITNNTTGAFVVIVKTAAGSGVTIPQNASPTRVSGDGTNIVQAPENVATPTQPTQAAQFGQLTGLIGQSANLVLAPASGTTFTLTADQIITGTALGGALYSVSSVSHTFNAATTGVNGMDTGGLPTTGSVAIYEIYNPTTGAKGLLGTALASITSVAPAVYGGANPVSGYTASGLVAVLRTISSAFVTTRVLGRRHLAGLGLITGTTTPAASPTLAAITVVPGNAKSVGGFLIASVNAAAAQVTYSLAADANSLGAKEIAGANPNVNGQNICSAEIDMATPGALYYTLSVGSGTGNCGFNCTSYTI